MGECIREFLAVDLRHIFHKFCMEHFLINFLYRALYFFVGQADMSMYVFSAVCPRMMRALTKSSLFICPSVCIAKDVFTMSRILVIFLTLVVFLTWRCL